MNLLKILYNNKPYLVLNLGTSGEKLVALKLIEDNKPTVPDSAINVLRSRILLYKSMKQSEILEELKMILPFNSIYRTFSLDKLRILGEYDIKPL